MLGGDFRKTDDPVEAVDLLRVGRRDRSCTECHDRVRDSPGDQHLIGQGLQRHPEHVLHRACFGSAVGDTPGNFTETSQIDHHQQQLGNVSQQCGDGGLLLVVGRQLTGHLAGEQRSLQTLNQFRFQGESTLLVWQMIDEHHAEREKLDLFEADDDDGARDGGYALTRLAPVDRAVGDAEDAPCKINVGENHIAQFLDPLSVRVDHGDNPCDAGAEAR